MVLVPEQDLFYHRHQVLVGYLPSFDKSLSCAQVLIITTNIGKIAVGLWVFHEENYCIYRQQEHKVPHEFFEIFLVTLRNLSQTSTSGDRTPLWTDSATPHKNHQVTVLQCALDITSLSYGVYVPTVASPVILFIVV